MKKIVFLASGGGGNMKFFHQALIAGYLDDLELTVIADRQCGSLEYAERNCINHFAINYSRSQPEQLIRLLEQISPDVIVTNWHKIIDAKTVSQFSGKLVNLHYSLLPAFAGLIGVEPIKQAYEKGCKFIGPTCHMVDEGVDTGRIIAQAVFTTDRSFEESISLMFRSGCLTLLNGVQEILGLNSSNRDVKNNSSVIYFPTSQVNDSSFEESFWEVIARG